MKAITAIMISILLAGLIGCAGVTNPTSPSPTITVTLSPSSASVPVSQTQQFTATVKGSSNTAVTWEVNGIAGGNSTFGTISSSGLFAAPKAVPNPSKVSVTAVAEANPSVSASALITVTNSPTAAITVNVTPLNGSVAAGATQQFTATLTGTSNTAVTWQVDGTTGGNATVGTISSSGLYTAPVVPPAGGSVVVTAIAAADVSKSGTASLTIFFSNASLNGQYAFGSEAVWTSVRTVGSFQADGKGNIVQGSEDTLGSSSSFTNTTFTGTYSVGADGRGSATFTSSGGTASFRLVVLSATSVFLIEVDTSSDLTALAVRQDPTAFSTSAFNGNYVFLLNSGLSGTAGRLTADGQGHLVGAEDVNSFGTISSNLALSGSYSVAASGRGTGSWNTSSGPLNLVFYMVSSGQLVMLDDAPEVGSALKQTLQVFSNASISGNYALLEQGVANGQSLVAGGLLTADGAGHLTGAADENAGGTVTLNTSVSGSYSIASTGRGTATLSSSRGTLNKVFYIADSTTVLIMDTDATRMTGGRASLQQGNSFTLASLKGSLGFGLVGFDQSGGDLNLLGQLAADGAGKIGGVEDEFVNNTANLSSSLTGSYTLAANGRGTAQVISANGTTNFLFYLTSSGTALVMGSDSSAVNLGLIGQQY